MLKCIAIDDDEYAIKGIEEFLATMPYITLVKSYTDPLLALNEITSGEKTDLIFMDVDMPMISGIELSKSIRHKTDKLIFTTSHSKYAFDAFEVEADAYLLKPYSFAKFASAINKLFPQKPDEPSKETADRKEDFFFVKDKESFKLIKVRFDEVIAVESIGNYIKIHTTGNKVIAYLSLTEMANILKNNDDFIQVQRSFIISKNHIISIEGNSITLFNNLKITIGIYYKDDLSAFVKSKTLKTGRK